MGAPRNLRFPVRTRTIKIGALEGAAWAPEVRDFRSDIGQYINQSLTVFTGPMGAAWAPEVSDFRSEFGQWIGPSERVRGPDWGPLEPPKSEISGPRLDSRFAGRC